jgi:hypothetical protein
VASEANVELASGYRCISPGHTTPVTSSILLGLSRAGVRYVSTRGTGYNHIDVSYAQSVGIAVGNVSYSPDSVADYMLDRDHPDPGAHRPGRIAAMSARASAAGAPDAGVVLARHVLTAVAERRRLAS